MSLYLKEQVCLVSRLEGKSPSIMGLQQTQLNKQNCVCKTAGESREAAFLACWEDVYGWEPSDQKAGLPQDEKNWGRRSSGGRALPGPRAMNRAVDPSSSAWALQVLNKNLIDDLSAREQTTLNFNRARMESLHKGLQFPR